MKKGHTIELIPADGLKMNKSGPTLRPVANNHFILKKCSCVFFLFFFRPGKIIVENT